MRECSYCTVGLGRMQRLLCAAVLALWCGVGVGTKIDNEVTGQPQVRCTEDSVTFSVRTQNTFRGNIYIKNKYTSPSCRQEYFSNDYNGATFSVRIGQCGMKRIRQLQPNGMNYMLVFVVNFHPQFVTKVDRAYNVRCFYAQIDKTVTSNLEVSMLTTQSVTDTTTLVPNCEYLVRSGTVNGPIVRYAQVGDRLFHVWRCTDDANTNFGMLVKNCFVNDGAGSSVRVLDTKGCPVFTPVIQSNLVYDADATLAYAEIWAYKFPDRANLYFQCQIQICNKRDNECLGVTPPNCPRTLKSQFVPNSRIQPGDPTRVVAGFNNNNNNNGFQANSPAASANRPNFERVQPQEVINAFQSNRIGNVRTFPANSNYQPGYKESQPGPGAETAASSSSLLQGPPAHVASNSRVPLRPLASSGNARSYLRDQPTKDDAEQSLAPGRTKRRKPALLDDAEGEETEDRMVMDVTAGQIYVADLEDDPDDDKGFTHFPFAGKAPSSQKGVCLNQTGVGLLFACGSLALLLILGLVGVVVVQKSKGRSEDGQRDSWSEGRRSVLSSVASSTTKIRNWLPSKNSKRSVPSPDQRAC